MKSYEHDRADRRGRIHYVVPTQVLCTLLGNVTACTLRMPELRVLKVFFMLVFICRLDRISSTDRIEALAK